MGEKKGIVKFLEFVLTRNIGTLVDCGVLWIFADCVFKGSYVGENIISPTISFEAAMFVNYLTSYFWIWRHRVAQSTTGVFWRHFIKYNFSSIAGFLVKMAFLLLFERLFGWHVVVCNLVALCISGLVNYFLAEKWVFRRRSAQLQHELLSRADVLEMLPKLNTKIGRRLASFVMNILGVSKVNRMYDAAYDDDPVAFTEKLLREMGCDYLVGNAERLQTLPQGAFITISNHPYGALDGIILVNTLGRMRPDFKVMVNEFLNHIKAMRSVFITVTPRTADSSSITATSISGVREVLSRLSQGHPVGFFPSGAVSDYHPRDHEIRDREWQDSLLRVIYRAKVPIVPIRFFDHNSRLYYELGLIDWKIRLLRLPREITNKHKGQHRLAIGSVISVEQQAQFADAQALGDFLRKAVYDMPLPETFISCSQLFGDKEGSTQKE